LQIDFFLLSSSNCRFCLQKFQDDEKQVEINYYIRKQFFVITQTELKTSQVYSDQICETCFNSARDLATFRKKLLENQQKLEDAFKDIQTRKRKKDFERDDDDPPEISFVNQQVIDKRLNFDWNKAKAVLVMKVEQFEDLEESSVFVSDLHGDDIEIKHEHDFGKLSLDLVKKIFIFSLNFR
jgi:Zinc-finger associated domain (zf-AD)